eukprot:SAG31_NODE_3463_length_4245_cov_2.612397_4_plen_588_part_00
MALISSSELGNSMPCMMLHAAVQQQLTLLATASLLSARIASTRTASAERSSLHVWRWNQTHYPGAVGCAGGGACSGPMAANGDLGVALSEAPDTATSGRGPGIGLLVALGKNDFWGWPGRGWCLWHSSFQHFTPGQLAIALVDVPVPPGPAGGPAAGRGGWPANFSFSGSQALSNGSLSASFRAASAGFGLSLREVQVLAEHNIVVGELVATCAAGVHSVGLNLSLADGTWHTNAPNQPHVSSSASLPRTRPLPADPAEPLIALTKANAPRHSLSVLLLPCSTNQVAYNALRNFSVGPGGSPVQLRNGSATPLCLRLSNDGMQVTVEPARDCSATDEATTWQLTTQQTLASISQPEVCLGAVFTNDTTCPNNGICGKCRSYEWTVGPMSCRPRVAFMRWQHLQNGFLRLVGSNDRCLAGPIPHLSNAVAVVASLRGRAGDGQAEAVVVRERALDGSSIRVEAPCNQALDLTLSVATERDAGRACFGNAGATAGSSAAYQHALSQLSVVQAKDDVAVRRVTNEWWAEWWAASTVDLGPDWPELQSWYETMMYLLRASTKEGSVAPALWGPWSTTDNPDWGDEMTLGRS